VSQLFDLLSLLDGIARHHGGLAFFQIFLQFLGQLGHFFDIALDFDLALLTGGSGLIPLNLI
jgi:hypothetical protein